jgi:predicted nucleic acid-binding protein
VIFLDTSAIYALADRDDPFHDTARARLKALLDAGEEVLTHNYILVEAMALLHARLGATTAQRFARDARAFTVEWIDPATHHEAAGQIGRSPGPRISFVDRVSFLIMRRRGVRLAFAFDTDFERAGFRLFAGHASV